MSLTLLTSIWALALRWDAILLAGSPFVVAVSVPGPGHLGIREIGELAELFALALARSNFPSTLMLLTDCPPPLSWMKELATATVRSRTSPKFIFPPASPVAIYLPEASEDLSEFLSGRLLLVPATLVSDTM